ncbi:MAG: MarC family protein [Phycisphaeraceae bacterium]
MLSSMDYVKILVSLIVVLDPIGTIPLFVAFTRTHNQAERHKAARTAAVTVAIVLVIAVTVGDWVLMLFGIQIATFRVGGGILVLLMAISMMHARISGAVQTEEEAREAEEKAAVAVVPLAIPLLAGPGAISAVIIFANRGTGLTHMAILCGVILLASGLTWLALRLATVLQPRMGKIGINIVTRLMGLILAAVAVEFIVNGVRELFPMLDGRAPVASP